MTTLLQLEANFTNFIYFVIVIIKLIFIVHFILLVKFIIAADYFRVAIIM